MPVGGPAKDQSEAQSCAGQEITENNVASVHNNNGNKDKNNKI